MRGRERGPLDVSGVVPPAVVPALAALVIVRDAPGVLDLLRSKACSFAASGQVGAARQFALAAQALQRTSGEQVAALQSGSGGGTSEVPLASGGAESAVSSYDTGDRKGLSVSEAAERLGVSRSYVTRLCRDSRLSAVRVGRAWLVDEVSLAVEVERRSQR